MKKTKQNKKININKNRFKSKSVSKSLTRKIRSKRHSRRHRRQRRGFSQYIPNNTIYQVAEGISAEPSQYKMTEIQKIIDIIPNLVNYTTIYIGIGAKYYDNNDYPILNTGEYQLVPQFIKNEAFLTDISKSLIIIVDEFNPNELEINNRVIHERLNGVEGRIDYIIVNSLFDDFIKNEISNLIENLTSQNIYIVDYVYYFGETPNKEESASLAKIKILLNELNQLLINKYNLENYSKLPRNKNIYKWLGAVEPNYISVLYMYDILRVNIPQAKTKSRHGNSKQLNKFINDYMFRITPDNS